MTPKTNDNVESALVMLAQLSPETRAKVRRRLAIRLKPTTRQAERKRHELTFVAQLLSQTPPPTGGLSAYVPRKDYDAERPRNSPSSQALVARYGSWVAVCINASKLNEDPGPNHRRGVALEVRDQAKSARRYTKRDAIAALRNCANELGRPPSSIAYKAWHAAAERRRRGPAGYPCSATISRHYKEQGGWIGALEDAGLIAPPPMIVRVATRNEKEAAELATAARDAGFVAAKAAQGNWAEIRATLDELRRAMIDEPSTFATATTLWEPHTRSLERIARDQPPERRHGACQSN